MKRMIKANEDVKPLTEEQLTLIVKAVNPGAIEQDIPHTMRFKEYDFDIAGPDIISFKWVTQEYFDHEGMLEFEAAVMNMAERIFDMADNVNVIDVTLLVRDDRSAPDTWHNWQIDREDMI